MNLTPLTSTSKKATGRKRWKKLALLTSAVFLLLISSGFIYEWIASEQASKKYAPPGQLVDVGGHKLHIKKAGSGSPTILLEAGSGETSLSWRDIPEQLASFATVVSYDRAGYTWSETATKARSGEQIVEELHTALDEAGMSGPYLLVGHSLGGMYARLFAQTYADEVSGLVLVDARPENDERETLPILEQENFSGNPPVWMLKLLKSSGAFRLFGDFLLEGLVAPEDRQLFINVIATPRYFEAKEAEAELAYLTEDAIRGQQLGNLPVKIIARGVPQDYASFGISEDGGKKLEDIWQAGQREMLNISSDSELIIAEKSGHMVIHDEPELIIQTIRSMLSR